MSINRVQKLLLSEYCDFEDLVLIESPFAETTKEGRGLRQVHLGLTPSKLILATDILPPVEPEDVTYNQWVDPEIETFELIAIYPVECVNLSVYRRKRRQAIKARFCNNRVLYFELGGFERRGMFWNLWCEKVKFLCPFDSGSSRSETSVATSTTGSSLYLIDKKVVNANGIRQLWCRFGPNYGIDRHNNVISAIVKSNSQSLVKKWTDRYVYLGKDFHEAPLDYKPIMNRPYLDLQPRKLRARSKPISPPLAEQKYLTFGDSVHVNRFGSGIFEGCGTGLYLTMDDYVVPLRYSATQIQTNSSNLSLDWDAMDFEEMAETAVLQWEFYAFTNLQNNRKVRHRRRYGFAPKPLFLYGLGPWYVTKGDRFSLQIKRAVSDVGLNYLICNKTLKLPVSKRQLLATVSSPALKEEYHCDSNNIINAPRKPVIFFWTPGYWYRPISAKDAYSVLQKHLRKIQEYHENSIKCKTLCLGRKYKGHRLLRRFGANKGKETDDDDYDYFAEKRKRKRCFFTNMLGVKPDDVLDWDDTKHPNETHFGHLKRILRVDVNLTAWDFDSTTLAQQLTMIDRDLFLKVSATELRALLWQQSSKNSPNIAAMIAFSYRISCLIASEILRNDSEKIRARLMARFINVANKCHRISNFHSCRSVLCGLQSPAIFRLRKTWAYVRKKHASKYQAFEFLCRLYRDPRMPSFQKSFLVLSQHPPYLPYIGHIIAKLFDKVPEYRIRTYRKPASGQLSFCNTGSFQSYTSLKSQVSRKKEFQTNMFTKLIGVFSNPPPSDVPSDCRKLKGSIKKEKASAGPVKFKGLYEYFQPLGIFEDSRKEMLLEVTKLLEKSQLGAVNYNFHNNGMTKSFLLKARHYDDQDNFFNSLNLESSRPSTIRNKKK